MPPSQDDGVEMLRVLVSMNPSEINARVMLHDLTIHHHRGLNWIVQLANFFPPPSASDAVNVQSPLFCEFILLIYISLGYKDDNIRDS